ncbi:hypothetical protein bcere0007_9230 [Bacillus mycoides]|nr:hypothetical protein bcere0007_9230 [Bacillus mycoides]
MLGLLLAFREGVLHGNLDNKQTYPLISNVVYIVFKEKSKKYNNLYICLTRVLTL